MTEQEGLMALSVTVVEQVDRPVAEVFQFYAVEHIRNHPRWDPDMTLEQVSDGPIGVGTIIRRRHTHSGQPVDGKMEVVEFEPDRTFSVIIQDGPNETRGRVTFESRSGGRTRLTVRAEFDGMDESKREHITNLMARSVGNIKRLIEAEP
jgi:hypothetical protein